MVKIDIELSAKVNLTEKELKLFKELIETNPSELVYSLLTTGHIELNGGFYFPESWTHEDYGAAGIEGNIKPMENFRIVKDDS